MSALNASATKSNCNLTWSSKSDGMPKGSFAVSAVLVAFAASWLETSFDLANFFGVLIENAAILRADHLFQAIQFSRHPIENAFALLASSRPLFRIRSTTEEAIEYNLRIDLHTFGRITSATGARTFTMNARMSF